MPGKRLSRITTKTGDQGQTGLGSSRRLPKQHIRIALIGDVDELNSAIGCVLAAQPPAALAEHLLTIQHQLFNLGGELAMDGSVTLLTEDDKLILERIGDTLNADLPALQEFILPGGSMAVAQCHLARAICRRAERQAFALAEQENVSAVLLSYLNRLSDVLFIIARSIAQAQGEDEVYWQSQRLQNTDSQHN